MAVEVELRPVDLDGVPIRVSVGKTTIGRGPFLRCSDKKVSRNHAVLDLSEDGVFTITSTHVNPSYYVKEGREKSEVLLPDKPQKLENGDQISLLANAYVYEVVIKELASDSGVDSNDAHKTYVKEETKSTTSTDEEEEEEDEDQETKDKNPDKKGKNPSVLSVSKKEDDEKTPTEVSDVKDEMKTEICDVEQSQTEENDTSTEMRKRSLPDWLIHSASASLTKAEPAPPVTQRRPGRPRKNKDASATPPPATHAKASTSTNDSPQARSTRAKKQISYYAVDDNDSDDDEFTTPKRKRSVGRSRDNDPDYSSNALRKNSGDDSEKESPKRKRKASGGSQTKHRHNCEYGAKCYRKNPTHFKEFSHPGDSDYSSDKGEDANDEQDEKPECEYGVDCFRKNPKHRREFKHTKKSRPKREAAKLARYADGDSDVDEGDEDFLDDESDEYNPEESDDDTDEDVGRLAKEAKSFVRNKKMYKMPK